MVRVEQISKTYEGPEGKICVARGYSVDVSKGEFVAVQGPNGCGKTTLLLMCGGLLRPDAGEVLVDGHDLYAMSSDRRARFRSRNIGFVFQQFHLIPYLSVRENVLVPSMGGKRSGDTAERSRELIDRFSLRDRSRHVPAELSTGERQRTAMARALFNDPPLLLADEPTGNLDEENTTFLLRCFREFAARGGTVLLVTHDSEVAASADRVLHLHGGRLKGVM